MLSGRRLDLLNPAPQDIEIGDIAHGLARVARWNGQTIGEHAFSVAQHALVVEKIFTACTAASAHPDYPGNEDADDARSWRQGRLAALLHDAPEYVIGDMISPFKTALGLDYKTFEHRLQEAIHLRFSLPAVLSPATQSAIKQADRISAYFEAVSLAGFSLSEADRYFDRPSGLPAQLSGELETLEAWPAATAQRRFLICFDDLSV